MISYDDKIIFIHINKCAGFSVMDSLQKLNDSYIQKIFPFEYSQHFMYDEYQKHLKTRNENINDYFTFTIVRNPWDRVVSYFLKGWETDKTPQVLGYTF